MYSSVCIYINKGFNKQMNVEENIKPSLWKQLQIIDVATPSIVM